MPATVRSETHNNSADPPPPHPGRINRWLAYAAAQPPNSEPPCCAPIAWSAEVDQLSEHGIPVEPASSEPHVGEEGEQSEKEVLHDK